MLIENPLGRGRANPVYVAPFSYTRNRKRVRVPGYVKNLPGERNPRGGKVANQLGVKTIQREWLAGMDVMDMGAALGGLASSTMIPGMIVRTADTSGMKLVKALVAFACAAGAGFVFRNISATSGKYAVAGGVAGALAQTLGMFTNVKIGGPMSRRISETMTVTPPYSRSDEQVQLIRP